METAIPDIYAVGDAVQVKHSVTGADVLISLRDRQIDRGVSQQITFAVVKASIMVLREVLLSRFFA